MSYDDFAMVLFFDFPYLRICRNFATHHKSHIVPLAIIPCNKVYDSMGAII
jgi:hypothetical protein